MIMKYGYLDSLRHGVLLMDHVLHAKVPANRLELTRYEVFVAQNSRLRAQFFGQFLVH